MSRPLPPWEYLAECSEHSLQSFMLSQMNMAAELKKSIRADQEKLMEILLNVELAGLLRHSRDELSRIAYLRQGVLRFEDRTPTEIPNKETVEVSDRVVPVAQPQRISADSYREGLKRRA